MLQIKIIDSYFLFRWLIDRFLSLVKVDLQLIMERGKNSVILKAKLFYDYGRFYSGTDQKSMLAGFVLSIPNSALWTLKHLDSIQKTILCIIKAKYSYVFNRHIDLLLMIKSVALLSKLLKDSFYMFFNKDGYM